MQNTGLGSTLAAESQAIDAKTKLSGHDMQDDVTLDNTNRKVDGVEHRKSVTS